MTTATAYHALPEGASGEQLIGPRRLTPRQAAVLRFLGGYFARHQRFPVLREVGAALGIGCPNGVRTHLLALQRKGLIRVSDGHGSARSVELVGLAERLAPVVAAHVEGMIGG